MNTDDGTNEGTSQETTAADGGVEGAQATQTASAPPAPAPRLVRRPEGKVVAGVCSGLGAYTGIDPVAWRIGFVVLALVSGVGLVAYLIAWVVTPMADPGEPTPVAAPSDPIRARRWVGVAAIVLGAILLFNRIWDLDNGFFWGFLLIGIGVAMWGRELTGGPSDPPPARPIAPPPPAAPPPPPPPPPPPGGPGGGGEPPMTQAASSAPRPPRRREHSVLGRVVVGAAALAIGIAVLLDNLSIVNVTPFAMILTLLLIVGAGLLVGTWWGRARWLIAPGILLTVALLSVALVPSSFRGGYGERVWRPTSVAELRDSYEWVAGDVLLDMSDLDLDEASERVDVSIGFGEVLVIVPEDATVVVDAHVQGGELHLFDGLIGQGWDVRQTTRRQGERDGGRLVLDADVGFGELRIRESFEQDRTAPRGSSSNRRSGSFDFRFDFDREER